MEQIASAHPFDCTLIEYHGWWPGPYDPFYRANIQENTDRINYYGADYVPHVYVDGLLDGGADSGLWEPMMLQRYAIPTPLEIRLSGTMFTDSTGTITAEITNTGAVGVGGTLHFTLSEDACPHNGKNYNYVMRDFFPEGAAGEDIAMGPGEVLTRTAPFVIKHTWVRRNMAVLVFVQDNTTQEMIQTGRIFFDLDQPKLVTVEMLLDDSAEGDGDGRLDPGESCGLVQVLGNLNPNGAVAVSGELTTADPRLLIMDASGSWPDIAPGETQRNDSDPFVLAVGEDVVPGSEIPVTLTVHANGDAYVREYVLTVPIGSPELTIGPDAYGYFAYEEVDASEFAPTYQWVEIDPTYGGPGTLLTLGDDAGTQLTLPFPFKYYGNFSNRLTVCSNGWIASGNQSGFGPGNGVIPGPDGPPNMIAAFWTDLDPSASGGGKVYTYNDLANGRFIVEFSRVRHWDTTTEETFEFIVYNPALYPTQTGDGQVDIQYHTVSDPSVCTVGIENQTETIGIQYLAFGDQNVAGAGLAAGRVLRFTTTPPNAASVDEHTILSGTVLLAGWPNPVHGEAQIVYTLPRSGEVSLRLYNVAGAEMRTLFHGWAPAGVGTARWNGKDDHNRAVPAGVYFYRLTGSGFDLSRKLVKQE